MEKGGCGFVFVGRFQTKKHFVVEKQLDCCSLMEIERERAGHNRRVRRHRSAHTLRKEKSSTEEEKKVRRLRRHRSAHSHHRSGRELHRIPTGSTKTRPMVEEEGHGERRHGSGLERPDSFLSVGIHGPGGDSKSDDEESEGSVHEFDEAEVPVGGRHHAKKEDAERAAERADRHRHRRRHGNGQRKVMSSSTLREERESAHKHTRRHQSADRLTRRHTADRDALRRTSLERMKGHGELGGKRSSMESMGSKRSSAQSLTKHDSGIPARDPLEPVPESRRSRPSMGNDVFRALGPEPRIVGLHDDYVRAGEIAASRGLVDGLPASVSLPKDMLVTYFPAGTAPSLVQKWTVKGPEISAGDAARVAMRQLRRLKEVSAVPTMEGGVVVLFPKGSFPRPTLAEVHETDLPPPEEVLSSEDEEEAKVEPGDDCVCVIM